MVSLLLPFVALAVVTIGNAASRSTPPPSPSTWAPLWLETRPLSANFVKQLLSPSQSAVAVYCDRLSGDGTAPPTTPVTAACTELLEQLTGQFNKGVRPLIVDNPAQAFVSLRVLSKANHSAWPPVPASEGFTITRNHTDGGFEVAGQTGTAVLYGTFHLLGLFRREDLSVLDVPFRFESTPSSPLRIWDLWDNRDRSVERGYAGRSVFNYTGLPTLLPRYTDYARLIASVGINGIVWDNVNACGSLNQYMMTPDVISSMAPLVQLFQTWGIRSYITPCYSSPILVGGLHTADPFNATVAQWWSDAATMYQNTWPTGSFAGFLIKADCEGQPGPSTYNRTELEGANAMADAIAHVGAVTIWRAFSHPPAGEDQALFQFELFKDWNGNTRDNVILQCKNGPEDFQVREPVHSLFGHLDKVNMIVEFEATQEYLGQAKHVAHLPSQWSTYFSFDTYLRNESNTTLADVVSGKLKSNQTAPRFTGTAAVSNFGDDSTWTGHPFSAANTYGYGRLAWDPSAPVASVTTEWIEATFGPNSTSRVRGDKSVNDAIAGILLRSWEAYENYTASLGWGFVCSGDHYDMDPASRNPTFINASKHAIGINRGTPQGYGGTYNSDAGAQFTDVDRCPEEHLLFFHNVPYNKTLKGARYGGATVLEWILQSHESGASTAAAFVSEWAEVQSLANVSATGATAGDIENLLQTGATAASLFAKSVAGFVQEAANGHGPGPVPPPPSIPGFDGPKKNTFCSTSQGGNRFYTGKLDLDACASGCRANETCACFDIDTSGTECRWLDSKYVLKGSVDHTAYVKSTKLHPRKKLKSVDLGSVNWFKSRTDMQFNSASGAFNWTNISKPDVVVGYLSVPVQLPATISMMWKSSGTDDCPPSNFANHGYCRNDEPCMHTSVHCLAGTGDFRIFVGDSSGAAKIAKDGFAPTTSYSKMDEYLKSAPFSQYNGYDFRIFPHVSTTAERYVPQKSGSTAVPCSINRKDSSQLFGKARLEYYGCFESKVDEWTELELTVGSGKSPELSMTMNNITRSTKDSESDDSQKPKKIDTVAIQYPNGRHYTYVSVKTV